MKNPQKIKNYFFKEWPLVLSIIVTGTIFNVFTVYIPIMQGRLIDSLIAGAASPILWAVAFFLLTILGVQVARFLKRLFVRKFANRINQSMRTLSYHHVVTEPFLVLQKENVGDLMTRIIGDVDITTEGIRKVTTETFDTGVLMISYFVTLLIYDVRLTVLASIFVPVAMLVAEGMKKVIYKTSKEYRAQMAKMASSTQEIAEHAILFRTHGVLDKKIENYDADLKDLEKKSVKSSLLENALAPLYLMIASLGVVFVLYYGGLKVLDGVWTLGTFLAYFSLFIAMAVKASKSAKLFNAAQKAAVSWQRIKPFLLNTPKEPDLSKTLDQRNLVVKNLSFSYPNAPEPIFSNVSFEAHAGEIIGITGPIASGKSSLGIALTGLYPYNGSILLDGHELRDYSGKERASLIAYLGHDPSLLSESIEDNVLLGKSDNLDLLFKDASFTDDLSQMPLKEKTLVGNGGIRLSGGQQARIALARALGGKKSLIILDDPFSAVDTLTETAIMDQLRKNYQDSIILIISHRLSLFPRVDKIIFLDDTIVYGNHQEMLEQSELYRAIFELQGGQR